MGNSIVKSNVGIRYSTEFKEQVVEYYKMHTIDQTMKEFGVSNYSINSWARAAGIVKDRSRYSMDFKHEVCQYYDNHTHKDTCKKFGIQIPTLFEWRKTLGYRNKSLGYNLYTEQLQPTVTKRERRNFAVTKSENGDLKAKVADLQYKLSAMELVVTQTLKGLGAEIESTLEAFDL